MVDSIQRGASVGQQIVLDLSRLSQLETVHHMVDDVLIQLIRGQPVRVGGRLQWKGAALVEPRMSKQLINLDSLLGISYQQSLK